MYKAHPVFAQPSDEHVRVWRYMDFTKFVSLLDSSALYFTRTDKFDDPFEGSWPKMNLIANEQVPDALKGHPQAVKNFLEMMLSGKEQSRKWPRFNAVNCWHMNEHESAAMWKLYLKSDEGIAIQSTYSKLRECFATDELIYLGLVKYIDYETESIDSPNLLAPFMYKRKSFEHEREIRALITRWPDASTGFDFDKPTIAHGVKIEVNIDKMVERIFVAPRAPDWLAELVGAVADMYGCDFPVEHSSLDGRPFF